MEVLRRMDRCRRIVLLPREVRHPLAVGRSGVAPDLEPGEVDQQTRDGHVVPDAARRGLVLDRGGWVVPVIAAA